MALISPCSFSMISLYVRKNHYYSSISLYFFHINNQYPNVAWIRYTFFDSHHLLLDSKRSCATQSYDLVLLTYRQSYDFWHLLFLHQFPFFTSDTNHNRESFVFTHVFTHLRPGNTDCLFVPVFQWLHSGISDDRFPKDYNFHNNSINSDFTISICRAPFFIGFMCSSYLSDNTRTLLIPAFIRINFACAIAS